MPNSPTREDESIKDSSTQTSETVRMRQGKALKLALVGTDFFESDMERILKPRTPPQEALTPLRSPRSSPLPKTFHAPRSKQICTFSTPRTFDPQRIDTLIAVLAEKLVSRSLLFILIVVKLPHCQSLSYTVVFLSSQSKF